jgi:hypothetical protein
LIELLLLTAAGLLKVAVRAGLYEEPERGITYRDAEWYLFMWLTTYSNFWASFSKGRSSLD